MSAAQGGAGEADEALVRCAVLIDELKHDDVQLRVNSMTQIGTIAEALGPERTRAELLPFLEESVDDDDDVLMAMAEGLDLPFVQFVGGNDHAHCLLPPLEQLSTVEEVSVRDRAVASITRIVGAMDEAAAEEHALPLLLRLGKRDWFTSRVAASGLAAAVFAAVSEAHKSDVVALFETLANDDTPMVRRAAAAHLPDLARVLPPAKVAASAVPVAEKLSSDSQDGIRLLAAEAFAAIAPLLPPADRASTIVPPVTRLAKDASWRVRWAAASHALAVCCALRGVAFRDPSVSAKGPEAASSSAAAGSNGSSQTTATSSSSSSSSSSAAAAAKQAPPEPSPDADTACAEVGAAFVELLADVEPEVRAAAAARVSQVARHVAAQTVTDAVMQRCEALAADENEHVRAALAGSVLGLAAVLEAARAEKELIPVVLGLLSDAASQVRLSVIERLEEVHAVVDTPILSKTLLPAIVELAADQQWRVRHALLGFMPLLARQLGADVFASSLTAVCTGCLTDDVARVRDDGAANLRLVADVFGDEWAAEALLPRLRELSGDQSYLIRGTVLRAAAYLGGGVNALAATSTTATSSSSSSKTASSSSSSVAAAAAADKRASSSSSSSASRTTLVDKHLTPLVTALFTDPVPNVRFAAARAAAALSGAASPAVREGALLAGLDKMRGDADADVRHFADEAWTVASAGGVDSATAAGQGGGDDDDDEA